MPLQAGNRAIQWHLLVEKAWSKLNSVLGDRRSLRRRWVESSAFTVLCDVISVVTKSMVRRWVESSAFTVLCDVISVVTESMVRRWVESSTFTVLCGVISVVTESMVRK
jgi:nicotinamide riboside transporter PnuC